MQHKNPLRVLVTGAAGQISYSLLPLLASGQVFGPDQSIILHLLDIPPAEKALYGIVMELEDCSYHLLKDVVYGSDPEKIFKDVQVAVFLGGFPRKEGMERKDLLAKNCGIFKQQGEVLNRVADKNCKSVVVANPANTNCLILSKYAPDIPKKNFTCLTRLDHNRAVAQLSLKSKIQVRHIRNVIIWGNHSGTQYPDISHGTIIDGSIKDVIDDDEYLKEEFIEKVQKRGASILQTRKLSSALSAANAVKDHLRDWALGTKEGEWVSQGIIIEHEEYGLPNDLCFSLPVKCKDFEFEVVKDLKWDELSKSKIELTKAELIEERDDALSF